MARLPRSGRPRTASTNRNTEKNQRGVRVNQCVTATKLATQIGIGQHTVQEMREIWDIGKSMPAGLLAC